MHLVVPAVDEDIEHRNNRLVDRYCIERRLAFAFGLLDTHETAARLGLMVNTTTGKCRSARSSAVGRTNRRYSARWVLVGARCGDRCMASGFTSTLGFNSPKADRAGLYGARA